MNTNLNQILHKRLIRMREGIDDYLKLHLTENSEPATFGVAKTQQKKKGGVAEKFLNYMKLNEESTDDFFFDDEYIEESDSCLSVESNAEAQQPKPPAPNRPHKRSDLLLMCEQCAAIDKVLEQKAETFSSMLLRLIDEKRLKDADVYKRANIDRRLFSKIRGDEDYVPSKKTAISFCLALQLELEEAKKLLATAGYTLSASSRFDLIIMYLIENCEYNIHFANIVLDDYGEGTLSR